MVYDKSCCQLFKIIFHCKLEIIACTHSHFFFHRALLYRRKYLTKDKFDNSYITFAFRDIDGRREESNKECVLPLQWKEKRKYIKSGQWFYSRLVT